MDRVSTGSAPLAERMLRALVLAGALVFAGYHAGGLTAAWLHPSGFDAATRGRADAGQGRATGEASPTEAAAAPIFGSPQPAEAAAQLAPENTDYTLFGITVFGEDRFALIGAEGTTRLVRQGERLPGGETVVEISARAVTLDRNGARSVLVFGREDGMLAGLEAGAARRTEEPTTEQEPAAPRVTSDAPMQFVPRPDQIPETTRPPLSLQALRRELLAPGALDGVSFRRARLATGEIGLQLRGAADHPLVDAAGLARGDVLVSVNEVPVTDPEALRSLLQALPKLDAIVIELERNRALQRVRVPITRG